MELALVNKPAYFNLSGNQQLFEVYIIPYFAAAQELGFRLNVTVEVESVPGTGVFQEAKQFTLWPSSDGKFQFDVSTIVAAYVKQYIPSPTLSTPVICESHIVAYRVKASLADAVKIIDTLPDSSHISMLGGLPIQEFKPGQFIEDMVNTQKQFLRYHTSREPGYLDQVAYLFFLTEGSDTFTPNIKIGLDDGSEVTTTLPPIAVIDAYKVVCVPIGFSVLNLTSLYSTARRPVWYEVSITKPAGIHAGPVRYYIDHRQFYNHRDLIFPNSLGGIDSIRLRGIIDSEVDITQVKSERVSLGQVFGNIISHQLNNYYTAERELIKGDTGFLTKDQVTRLRDLFLQKQVFEVDGARLLPVEISARNVKLYTNRDSLYNLALEYRYGYDNTHWSTRNLLSSTVGSCPAMAFGYAYRKNAADIEIIYALPAGYDLVEFKFNTLDQDEWYRFTGNTGKISLPKAYVAPAEGMDLERYVYGRVICNPNTDPVDAGPWLMLTYIEVLNNRLVVGNDTIEVPYGLSSGLVLQQNILENDYDETGANIACTPVAGQPTEKAGTVSITADGIVTYLPPATNFIGTDTYVYTVLADGGGTGTGTIFFIVGNPEVGAVVFVKIVIENVVIRDTFLGFGSTKQTNGDVYLYFYRDFAATQPLDVTNSGLIVNVQQRDQYDLNGDQLTTDTTINKTGVGTKTKIYSGMLYLDVVANTDYRSITFSILPGTGYQKI